MSPNSNRPRQPAEWTRHAACWLAWPSAANLWEDNLLRAQAEFQALARAITGIDHAENPAPVEKLEVLVPDEPREKQARAALAGLPVRFHRIPFGDIWLRDTAPIFVRTAEGKLEAASFAFNGWGGKYVLPHDSEVSEAVGRASGLAVRRYPVILEGGSVEVDGEGTCLTTRQCLLNPNRNPYLKEEDVERVLAETLGAETVLWLDNGLINDHTDGHIDTLARFVRPGVVVCMESRDHEDPNAANLETIARQLESFTDSAGRKLSVVRIPSPGRVLDEDGRLMPASYVNFYIANRTVVVPTYGTRFDTEGVRAIADLFPDRHVMGLSSRAILSGGGAFHCITQQVPE